MPATTATTSPQARSSAGLFVAAFAGAFLFGCISSFWGMVVPALEKSLGSVANILLGNSIGLVVGSLLVGPAIDRLGKKVALAGGMFLVTAGVAGLGLVNSAGAAVTMAVLIGVGGSAIVTGANALISDISTMRATWLNLMNNAFAVGGALAAVTIPPMIVGQRFQPVAWALAGIAGLALLYYLALPFPPPLAPAGSGQGAGAGDLLGHPLLWTLAAMLFLYVGCEGTMWYWMNKYLVSDLRLEPTSAGWTFFLFPIGIIVGRAISSWLLLKMDALKLTLAATVAITVAYTGILLVRDPNAVRLFVFLTGFTMAPLFPTVLAATGAAFSRATGTAMGLVITGGWLGYVAIPPTIGRVGQLHSGLFITSGAAVLLIVANVVALRLAGGRAQASGLSSK